jgi:hypothetical protein
VNLSRAVLAAVVVCAAACGEKTVTKTEIVYAPEQPGVPTIEGTDPASPAQATRLAVLGRTIPKQVVSIYGTPDCSGTALGAATANDAGEFSVSVSVEENATTTFHATGTLGELVSACSKNAFSYTSDTIAPDAPTVSSLLPGAVGASNDVKLVASAEPGATVQLFAQPACEGDVVASVVPGTNGVAVLEARVEQEGVTKFSLRAIDSAGNASECTESVSYRLDTSAPAAPHLTDTMPSGTLGLEDFALVGNAPEGTSVLFYSGASCEGEPIAAAAGGPFTVWVDNTAQLGDGFLVRAFSAQARNSSGISSTCASWQVVIDADAPTFSNVKLQPSYVAVGTAVLEGMTSEAGTVYVSAGEGCQQPRLQQATVANSFSVSLTLGSGTNTFSVFMQDSVGNSSECEGPFSIDFDNAAPSPIARVFFNNGESWLRSNTQVGVYFESTYDNVGVTAYEVKIATNAACVGALAMKVVTQGQLLTLDGQWSDGDTLFVCVTASDAAGNQTLTVRGPVRVDAHPATPVSSSPANGATGVPVDAEIRVDFGEPLLTTNASVTLTSKYGSVSGQLTMYAGSISFKPAQLYPWTTYTAQLKGFADLSGYAADITLTFETGAGWTPFSRDGAQYDGGTDVLAEFAPDGSLWVLSKESGLVFARRFDPRTGQLQKTTNLLLLTSDMALSGLVKTPDGLLALVETAPGFIYYNKLLALRLQDGVWNSSYELIEESTPGRNLWQGRVAADSAGVVHVVYHELTSTGGYQERLLEKTLDENGWSAAREVEGPKDSWLDLMPDLVRAGDRLAIFEYRYALPSQQFDSLNLFTALGTTWTMTNPLDVGGYWRTSPSPVLFGTSDGSLLLVAGANGPTMRSWFLDGANGNTTWVGGDTALPEFTLSRHADFQPGGAFEGLASYSGSSRIARVSFSPTTGWKTEPLFLGIYGGELGGVVRMGNGRLAAVWGIWTEDHANLYPVVSLQNENGTWTAPVKGPGLFKSVSRLVPFAAQDTVGFTIRGRQSESEPNDVFVAVYAP